MRFHGSLRAAGATDTGRVRQHNEDAIHLAAGSGYFLLADGMGGQNAGEVASAMVMEVTSQVIDAALAEDLDQGLAGAVYSAETELLRSAINQANRRVFASASENAECEGMGTTVVAALLHGTSISLAHVGDSRIYRLRSGQLEQLTVDHSFVQEMLDRQLYTEEEARNSRNKNVITRAMGMAEEVEVDVQEDLALAGDIYLLCSDGLTGMVEDQQIAALLAASGDDLDKAVADLIAEANHNGGKDNISVVLIRIEDLQPQDDAGADDDIAWFD